MAFSTHDQVPDSPTNTFATLNPLTRFPVGNQALYSQLTDGNLKSVATDNSAAVESTFKVLSGKWYFEAISSLSSYSGDGLGFGSLASNFVLYRNNGHKLVDGTDSNISGDTWTSNNQVAGVCIDMSSGEVEAFVDGVSQGVIDTLDVTDYITPIMYNRLAGTVSVNFGQDPTFGGNKSPTTTYTDANGIGQFYYEPPTGAKALCTANLPDFTPDVTGDVPQEYFKTVLYTGQNADSTFTNDGGNSWSKTGVGFQPDFVWLKERSSTSNHEMFDVVRGVYKNLEPNTPNQEGNYTETLQSFDSDGFTVGTSNAINESGQTYVAWCWKAGGNSNTFNINGTGYSTYSELQTDNTSLPAITSGMIVPSGMSINTDAGFSIVTFTASTSAYTFCHGLNEAPEMILFKNRDRSASWSVYHKDIGATKVLRLDTADAATTSGSWNNTAPTSTVVHNGGLYVEDCVAFCWHSVEGYSKFGSYTGNGSTDGPFVYCGFRPAFVMVKNTSSSEIGKTNWSIFDTARQPFNVSPANNRLEADTANAEDGDGRTGDGGNGIDFLSNGFKVRSGGWYEVNYTAGSYIFMAFAEQPFKFSNAR